MKHKPSITAILILVFFIAQLVGLTIVNEYIDIGQTSETGKTAINKEKYDMAGFQPPELKDESFSFLYILCAVLIGTVLLLLIIKFNRNANVFGWWILTILLSISAIVSTVMILFMKIFMKNFFYILIPLINIFLVYLLIKFRKQFDVWKFWFFMSVLITLMMAWSQFIFKFIEKIFSFTPTNISVIIITGIIAASFAFWKIFKPNLYVHNFTEVFVYGGLAALLVPILDLFSVIMLLILISAYDMYAVWKSKHMVKIAKFQTKTFAGLMIPYSRKKEKEGKEVPAPPGKGKPKTAILGGGDVAFPLLFSGVVMKTTGSYLAPFITTIFVSIALALLLIKSEKGKFYPAMPFLTAGCFAGLLVLKLFSMI